MTWWRNQMETFSALLAICAGNSPVPVEFPVQRPVTRSFDVFFDLRPNKRLSKHSWGWWFETLIVTSFCLTVRESRALCVIRDHYVYTLSQWEMVLQCNAISYWLGACTKWSCAIQCCLVRNAVVMGWSIWSPTGREKQLAFASEKKMCRW